MYPRPVISNSTTCGKGADTWRTPMPAHIGAAPSLATRTKPPASRFPSARMRCAKAGAAVLRTNQFRDSGGAHRSGTATAREAGPAHRFHGIAGRDAAGVRMPTAQGRPRPEKALRSLGKVASRRVPRAAASSASGSREAARSFTPPGHATGGRRLVACQAAGTAAPQPAGWQQQSLALRLGRMRGDRVSEPKGPGSRAPEPRLFASMRAPESGNAAIGPARR